MTINSLTSGTASSLAYTSRLSGTSSATATQQAGRTPPPPPPSGEGGGLLGALADALQSIGVGGTAESGTTAGDSETGTTGEAEALGSFLDNLMAALHAQNSGAEGVEGTTAPPYGEAPQGGPGKLSSDLQSLISALGDGTTATDSTASAGAADGTSALQDSFKNLLAALGGDAGDADTKLSGFLQTLAARLPSAGTSGNLVDTTA